MEHASFVEDIKKSIEAATSGDYEPSPQRYVIVSEHLLSRLEIAEKSLEDVAFEADVPVADIAAIKRLSTEALQQLRS